MWHAAARIAAFYRNFQFWVMVSFSFNLYMVAAPCATNCKASPERRTVQLHVVSNFLCTLVLTFYLLLVVRDKMSHTAKLRNRKLALRGYIKHTSTATWAAFLGLHLSSYVWLWSPVVANDTSEKHITVVRVFTNCWNFCRFSQNQGRRKYWHKFLRCVLACSLGSQYCKCLQVCVCIRVCAFLNVIELEIVILYIYVGSTSVLLCCAFSALTYKWHRDVKHCVSVCNTKRKIPAHFAKIKTKAHEAGNLLGFR